MDFVDYFPFYVVELIFQHVSGKDALQMMEVSKVWNDHISRSSVLKKIIISPTVYSESNTNLNYLLNSRRKYQHIKVINGTAINREVVEIIANPLHEFNSIVLFRTLFDERKQIEQIFLNSSHKLERLEIHYVDYERHDKESSEDITTTYDFPKLKHLCIQYYDGTSPWINRFIGSFPMLESITLEHGCDEHFKNLMLKSSRLKKLILSGKIYDETFYKDMSIKFPPQLDLFVFNNILSSSKEDRNLRYFNDFFTSQSEKLKRFETDALLEIDEFESAFKMPNLKELYIKGIHYNVEIMEVYLEHMRTKELPTAALTCFSVHVMNQHLLELLALNAKNLLELKVAQFHPTDVSNPSWFLKLKCLRLFFIDSDIRKRLKEKPDEKRSHFEQMIVKSMTSSSSFVQPLMLFNLQGSSELN